MGSFYRKQEEKRLEISDGNWLLVRKHLTAGDQREAHGRLIKPGTFKAGERPDIDPKHLGIAQACAYLLDWSVTDENDQPIRISGQSYEFVMAALENMTPEGCKEIIDAIDDHDTAMVAEREAEKKNTGWRDRIVSDLYICRVMGWTYDELLDLPVDVYSVLVETLNQEVERSRK